MSRSERLLFRLNLKLKKQGKVSTSGCLESVVTFKIQQYSSQFIRKVHNMLLSTKYHQKIS